MRLASLLPHKYSFYLYAMHTAIHISLRETLEEELWRSTLAGAISSLKILYRKFCLIGGYMLFASSPDIIHDSLIKISW